MSSVLLHSSDFSVVSYLILCFTRIFFDQSPGFVMRREVQFEFRSWRLLHGMEVGLSPVIYFPSEVTFCEVLRSLLPYEVS